MTIYDDTLNNARISEFFSMDVYPHGIEHIHGETYALYKCILIFNNDNGINTNSIKEDFDNVNALNWYYQFNEVNNILSIFCKSNNEVLVDDLDELKFHIPNSKSPSQKFQLGYYFNKKGNPKWAFKAIFDCLKGKTLKKDFQNSSSEPITTRQFETNDKNAIADSSSVYGSILDNSNKYAEGERGTSRADKINFEVLISNINNEPLLAEHHYGLIRTFKIPIHKFKISEENSLHYEISVNGCYETPNSTVNFGDEGKFPFEIIKKNDNYYNGLKVKELSESMYDRTNIIFNDPYSSELSSNTKNKNYQNADGIYVMVKYKDENRSFKDPIEENLTMAGYNVLIKHKNNNDLLSLSMHKLNYKVKNPKRVKYEFITSGMLNSMADLMTDKKEAYRSNILVAFKGENLAVTRKIKPKIKNKDYKLEVEKVDDDYREENVIIEKQFSRDEDFIKGGNVPLLSNLDYNFYLRPVTPTGYFPLSKSEIEKISINGISISTSQSRTIPFEDLNPVIFISSKAKEFPIINMKAPTIIGKDTYVRKDTYQSKKENPYVDNHTHIVVNKIEGEKSEKRYVYPPQISFFDFRVLGNLASEKLSRKGENKPTIGEFIRRVKLLENRSLDSPKNVQNNCYKIMYLADRRAKKINFIPNDLVTATSYGIKLKAIDEAFNFNEFYPFYRKLRCGVIEVKSDNSISYDDKNLYKVNNGIYSFSVNSENVVEKEKNKIKGSTTNLKISVVDYPKEVYSGKLSGEAKRVNEVGLINKWYFLIEELKNIKDDSRKSIKYLEETEVLKLQHENIEELISNYEQTQILYSNLLKGEFPYSLFLTKEGNIDDPKDLQTSIYPSKIAITLKIPEQLKEKEINQKVLEFKISDKDVLSVNIKDGSVIFELNELEIFTSVFNSIELVNLYIKRTDFSYILKTNNRKTSASTITKLNSHPYRDISISNFIVSEKLKVLECKEIDGLISCKTIELDGEPYFAEQIANNNAELDFKIEEFSFLKDESQPYYRLKRIKFFASSIFQPHFPLDSSEFKMGKLSPKKMELIIPNNIKPEKPEFETDILFYKDIDKSWSLKNEKIKESKTEQLVRITLSQDFMKEGPNLLGVVLNKVTNGKQKVTDETSAIGEDITKLMENSKWGKNNNLEPKIRNKEDLKKLEDKVFSSIVSKYFPDFKDSKNIKVYKIGEEAYRVLHLKPFYNVTLKKWQVILSFKDLKQVETVFIRIVLMKIAKGYGLKEIKEELWSDTTGTNLSNFTKPDILPLYNTKHYKINKLSHKGSQALKIKIDSDVNYDKTKKVYVIMVSNSRKKSNILNVKEKNEKVKYGFEDIQVRKPLVIDNNAKNKNIVLFKGKEAIIERKGFKKLFLFEFEIHDNANKTIQDLELSEAIYLDFNPLFDPEKQNEGLRLINFQEFKV